MNPLNWQQITPQLSEFDDVFSNLSHIDTCNFSQVQPRLNATLERFANMSGITKTLLIKSTDSTLYRDLIRQSLLAVTDKPVVAIEDTTAQGLFDSYNVDRDGYTTTSEGLLSKANHGFLILPATLLLANPHAWYRLKTAIQGGHIKPTNLTTNRIATVEPEAKPYDVKVVIVGDRDQHAELDYLDAEFSNGFSMYTEIEEDIHLSSESLVKYIGYVKWIAASFGYPSVDREGFERLLIAGMRYTEDQHYLPLSVTWHTQMLGLAAQHCQSQTLSGVEIDAAIDDKYYRESYLPQRAVDDILDGQVVIETTGEQVGQINGLTVVDMSGHPVSYGEPARISCVIHFGDGDISDVERKAELGGNLHAKGMMIMQAFVSSALRLDEPLPYSASIVFEQSYSEVDGDSASLAELCCLVSALSETPIDQQIAVTGAVDQFGRVQAVGGLNEKIEGFYQVCKHQGFTGKQGVIMPKTNLKHLSLHKDVVESIKSGEFHIWAVSEVGEAIPLLMNKPFQGEDEDAIINKIAERIDNFGRPEESESLLDKIKAIFNR